MLRKRVPVYLLIIILLFGLVAGAKLNELISGDNLREQIQKFSDVLSLTQRNYVEKVDTQKLVEAAIAGLLTQLDPHSVYIPPKAMSKVTEDFRGSFDGIGIEFDVINDTILVVAPIAGGPSEALGIMAGDKIVKIDGQSCIGIKRDDVPGKLRGPKGTKVVVTIYRAGMPNLIDFNITRDKIPIYTVDAAFMVTKDVGYISVNRFAQTTYEEFKNGLSKLLSQGMTKLILDLRGNTGGFLDQAFLMADELIPAGKKIVYTKGRLPEFDEEYFSSPGGSFESNPVIVLVDEGSASASEIVAGAIQDNDRGLIVGETTFGKGLVQRQWDLIDGSAIRITTARYYTPSGRLIQKPYDKGRYTADMRNKIDDEGENIDHNLEKDSTKPVYKTVGGRKVLGGGGITPDFVVKPDTLTLFSRKALSNREWLLTYVNSFMDQHGKELREKYKKDIDRFISEFVVTDEILKPFIDKVKEKGVEFNKEQYNKDEKIIKTLIKAYFARNIWGNEGWYKVRIDIDNQLLKAIKLFPEAEKLSKLTKK